MKNPLILIPGTLCDASLFAAQVTALSDLADCRVVESSQSDSLAGMAALILAEVTGSFALLGLSYGVTGKMIADDDTQPLMDQALATIVASCRKHQVVPGIFSASAAECGQLMQRGFRFITLKSDGMILSEYATQLVNELRTALPATAPKLA